MPIDHWMLFGTFAEKRYFVYPKPATYTGVVINANMAAYAPDGLAAFLLEMTAGTLRYVIDPLSHAFQHDPVVLLTSGKEKEGTVKKSLRQIADAYGSPIEAACGKRPVLPKDFEDDHLLHEFVDRCIAFQRMQLAEAMTNSDSMKYLSDFSSESLQPYAIVAPYFYMTETSLDRWLPINTSAVAHAVKQSPGLRVFASVVISQGILLRENAIKRLLDAYTSVEADGFFIWVDGLDEHVAGGAELAGLVSLAQGLRQKHTKEVINLHGGYFSVLSAGVLGDSAMSGVTHGPEFGEARPVVPVGGGIPIARYYIPLLHARTRYRDAVRLLRDKGWLSSASAFHEHVCNCLRCRQTIAGTPDNFALFGEATARDVKRGDTFVRMQFPTGDAKIRCLEHYLQCKEREYQFAATASREQIICDLDQGVTEFEDVAGLEAVSHLALWKSVLTSDA